MAETIIPYANSIHLFTSIDLINLKDLIDAVTNNIYKLNV